MIIPTKHIPFDRSLIGSGAFVLPLLDVPLTPSGLWDRLKESPRIGNYGRFILVLDFLYAIGAIDLVDGLIVRRAPQ